MIPGVDHSKIQDKALDVLEQFGITEPVVDVLKIAQQSKIDIKEIKMPDKFFEVAGFYDKANRTIYVSELGPPQRKLFTIAHELGHIFLNHDNFSVRFRLPKENKEYPKEETEANSFAAHLLMPDHMIKEALYKYRLTRGDYVQMAKIFGVPVAAMRDTLTYLH